MATFENHEVLAERIRNNPPLALARLEEILTDEQAAALDAALAPVVGPEERVVALKDARRVLARAGIATGDSIATALDQAIVVAEAAVPAAPLQD